MLHVTCYLLHVHVHTYSMYMLMYMYITCKNYVLTCTMYMQIFVHVQVHAHLSKRLMYKHRTRSCKPAKVAMYCVSAYNLKIDIDCIFM